MSSHNVAIPLDVSTAPAPRFSTLVEMVLERARDEPDEIAYAFLDPSKPQLETLSFGALAEEVRGLAAWLQARGAFGERCLILLPPGLGYAKAFLACQLAGAVAVPAYFPELRRLNRSLQRLSLMVRDANARFAITTGALSPLLAPLAVQRTVLRTLSSIPVARRLFGAGPIKKLSVLPLPDSAAALAPRWKDPNTRAESLSFLQYTSGSTNDPRGVALTHGNLLANLHAIETIFGIDKTFRCVTWLPPYHDMGLIGAILTPLYIGMRCDMMSPLTFVQRPSVWLETISRTDQRLVSGGPNFAYDLCVRRVREDQRKKLDLSRWEVAFCGAEPIRSQTLERFVRAFEPCGFRSTSFLPSYGLAESTLLVTGGKLAHDPEPLFRARKHSVEQGRAERAADNDTFATVWMSCGQVIPEHRVRILDPDARTPRGPCEVGEIWVSGPSVAAGYWNHPEKSRETFQALAADGEGPFLRTGDLGFLDRDGRLFVTGRIKDLIIVGGRKYYPQDIEATLQKVDPSLRVGCGAAFAVPSAQGEELVLVQEVASARAPEDLRSLLLRICEEVSSAHEVAPAEVVLVRERTVPKTSSGKLQRAATRALYRSNQLEGIARWSAPRTLPNKCRQGALP
jgi:acyl-CoA synthetase (AMP-forming)/AMP-acid ligase II